MRRLRKLKYYLKQLLPLTYRSYYIENDEYHFCVWRMWFRRRFDIDDVVVKAEDGWLVDNEGCIL